MTLLEIKSEPIEVPGRHMTCDCLGDCVGDSAFHKTAPNVSTCLATAWVCLKIADELHFLCTDCAGRIAQRFITEGFGK